MIILKILILLCSYLLGSIPFGLIISKIKNNDLRKQGSHNIGAANAARVLGKKYAFLTFFLDMLKGALFASLFRYNILPKELIILSPSLYGLAACIGHCFPIFLKFKGGKGVATGAGLIFAYYQLLILIAVPTFLLIVKKTKIASLGSLISGFSMMIISISLIIIELIFFKTNSITGINNDYFYIISIILVYLIIIYKHIPNIKRIINKNENTIHKIS